MKAFFQLVGMLFLGVVLSSSQATIRAGHSAALQDCTSGSKRTGRASSLSDNCVEQLLQAMCGTQSDPLTRLQRGASRNLSRVRSATTAVAGDGFLANGSKPLVRPRAKRWSDPATWGGQVPAPGATVLIPAGQLVMLDQDARVAGLRVEGGLVFDRKDLHLQAEYILVSGRLEIGNAAAPFRQRALITLIGPESNLSIDIMGTKFLSGMGKGTIEMVGDPGRSSWTQLAETAAVGAQDIVVLDAAQ